MHLAGGQKLQAVTGCGHGDVDAVGLRHSENFLNGHRIVLFRPPSPT
jgi:hypothetical protein